MGDTGRVTGLGKRRPRSSLTRSIAATAILVSALVSGCAGSASDEPNTAGNATAVPGAIPGIGTAGDITVSGLSIHRTGDQLAITAQIRNSGTAADQLLSISSQVTETLTKSPALAIPAKSTVSLGAGGTATSLTINARLEAGGSVALTLNFRDAGAVDDYSSFSGS
jgi:hypothetical protein